MMKFKIKQNGWTLIELLIVIAIFSIISVISYSALTASFKGYQMSKKHNKEIVQIQKTLHYLERDIAQIYNPSVTLNKSGLTTKSIQNNHLLEINYEVIDGELIRKDNTDKKNPVSLSLIKDISKSQVRALDNKGKWHTKWPSKDKKLYLKVIEVEFEHPNWGIIKKLILLNDAQAKV